MNNCFPTSFPTNCFPTGNTGAWFNQNTLPFSSLPFCGTSQFPGAFNSMNCAIPQYNQFCGYNTLPTCNTTPWTTPFNTTPWTTPFNTQFNAFSHFARPTFNWPVNVPQAQYGTQYGAFGQPVQTLFPYNTLNCTTPWNQYGFQGYGQSFGHIGQNFGQFGTTPFINQWTPGVNSFGYNPQLSTTPFNCAPWNCYGADCNTGVCNTVPYGVNGFQNCPIPQGFGTIPGSVPVQSIGAYGQPISTYGQGFPVQGFPIQGFPIGSPIQGAPVNCGQTPVGAGINCDNAYGIRTAA